MQKFTKQDMTTFNIKYIIFTSLNTSVLYQAQFNYGSQYLIYSSIYDSDLTIEDFPGNIDDSAFIDHKQGLALKNIKLNIKVLIPFQGDFQPEEFMDKEYIEFSKSDPLARSVLLSRTFF